MAFDHELMPARTQRDLGGHDFQQVIHDIQYIDRFGGQGLRQAVIQLALQRQQAWVVAASLAQTLLQLLAQCNHQGVVALQVALHIGQFLALAEQALRQHLLAGQQAFAHAPAEGIFLDVHDALEHAALLQLGLRVQLQQGFCRDQAVAQPDFPGTHALLQHAARHAHQLRGAPDRHPLRHEGSGVATRSR